jgi:cytochrome c
LSRSARNNRYVSGILLAVAVAGLAAWICGSAWYYSQQRSEVVRLLTQGDASRAPLIMRRYGCSGCHTASGIPGADGQVGGPLVDLRKRVFIGGVVTNTADNLIGWLISPQKFSPHSAMPPTGITEAEARDVAAYLYER